MSCSMGGSKFRFAARAAGPTVRLAGSHFRVIQRPVTYPAQSIRAFDATEPWRGPAFFSCTNAPYRLI